MSTLQIYLLLKLDILIDFFGVVGAIPLIFLCIVLAIYADSVFTDERKDEIEQKKKMFFSVLKWAFPLGAFFVIMAVLLPTTNQMAIIYVVPKIINNTQVQNIPGKLLTLTDEWIDKLRPENIQDSMKTVTKE
jgi:hypothetical protein